MDIQVWIVEPNADPSDLCLLPRDEQDRAGQMSSSRRAVYLAARLALHQLLSLALGGGSNIQIDRRCSHCGDALHGKPTVMHSKSEIDFSVSYGEGNALVALAYSTRVGVDIQSVAPGFRPHPWCFSRSETEYLDSLDEHDRDLTITRAWTRKEALAKADGRGLAMPLSSVIVTGPPSEWRLPSDDWKLLDLEIGTGNAATIAYDSPSSSVKCMPWTGDMTV